MKRIASLVAASIVTLAAASAAHAADWSNHRYAEDGFTVDYSGEVITKPLPLPPAAQARVVRATSYMQGGETYAYMANATLLKPGTAFDFKAAVEGTMAPAACQQVDSDKEGVEAGHRVREVRASKCAGGQVRIGAKFFMKGDWFYQVFYYVPDDATAIAEGERFLSSFKLLDS